MFCTDFENVYIENRVETFSKKERNKNEKRLHEIEGVDLDEGQD